MTTYASAVRRPLSVSVDSASSDLFGVTPVTRMSKRYQILKRKLPVPSGGFVEAFVMGVAEYSCLGEQHFDLSGYPYETEMDAFADDWKALSKDAFAAADKLKASTEKK